MVNSGLSSGNRSTCFSPDLVKPRGGIFKPPRHGGISLPLPARSPPIGVRSLFNLSASFTDTAALPAAVKNRARVHALTRPNLFIFIKRPQFLFVLFHKNNESCSFAQIKLLLTTS